MEPVGFSKPPERRTVAALSLALGPPVLFLTLIGVRYNLADLSCEHVWPRTALEVAAGIGLIGMLAIGWMAFRRLNRRPAQGPAPGEAPDRWNESLLRGEQLLLMLSCLLAPLFAVLQLAQWMPQWILGACH